MLRLLAVLAGAVALLVAAPVAHALDSCYGAPWDTECDAYFWDSTMGTVEVSRTTVEPGGLVTLTATTGNMAPYWSRTQDGYVPSGVGQVVVKAPGTVVAYEPKASAELDVAADSSSVRFTGVELNPPNHGVPTSKFGTGKSFTVTFRLPERGIDGKQPATADYAGNRGFVRWGDQSRRFFEVHDLPDVTLSGTLRKTICDPVCKVLPAEGEVVDVSGTDDYDEPVSRKSEPAGADGSWSVQLPRGTYVVTPPSEMEPATRNLRVTGDVPGLDFLRPAMPINLPIPDPVPPVVEEFEEIPPDPLTCKIMCLPRPEVLSAKFVEAGDKKPKRKGGGRKRAKAKASARQTQGPAKLKVLVKGAPEIRYVLHLVEGAKCRKKALDGPTRALASIPVTIDRDGKAKVRKRVAVGSGRAVSAYVTDGRDRSPYAECRTVKGSL